MFWSGAASAAPVSAAGRTQDRLQTHPKERTSTSFAFSVRSAIRVLLEGKTQGVQPVRHIWVADDPDHLGCFTWIEFI